MKLSERELVDLSMKAVDAADRSLRDVLQLVGDPTQRMLIAGVVAIYTTGLMARLTQPAFERDKGKPLPWDDAAEASARFILAALKDTPPDSGRIAAHRSGLWAKIMGSR